MAKPSARRGIGTAAVAAALALLLSACLVTRAATTRTVTAPNPAATGFGSAFHLDEDRLVVRAEVGGSPVVYVFDDAGSGWQHHSTIAAPPSASGSWARSISVSGDEIAIADPGRETGNGFDSYGAVTVHRWSGTRWTIAQTLTSGRDWDQFAAGVWLGDDGLVVSSSSVCDGVCSDGAWTLYHRYGFGFSPVFRTTPGIDVSVGVDAGRFAIGVPGGYNETGSAYDNTLRVIDANVTLPRFVLDQTVPIWDDDGGETTGLFRSVDLSGDVLAYESCCTSDARLHLRRFDGSDYRPEATFPLSEASAGVVAMDDLVLVADAAAGVFRAYAFHDGEWERSSDLKVPAGAGFAVPPVAAGDRVAVAGNGSVHILTVEVVDPA
jgi:hypothetical protein